MKKRGVLPRTLQNKCSIWSKRLRLGDWTIKCRYATKTEMSLPDPDDDNNPCFDDNTIGRLHECSTPEKIAVILIRKDYYNHQGYGVYWNLDTLIIHELIHIILNIGKQSSKMGKKIQENSAFESFEEFACDSFAAILYYIYFKHI